MKNCWSPGKGGLPAELSKHGEQKLMKTTAKMINKCITCKGSTSVDNVISLGVTSIYKKENRRYNCRVINFIGSVSRLFGRIQLHAISDEQTGFIQGRPYIDHINIIKKRN